MNHLWKKVLLSLIVTAGLINPTQSSCMFRRVKAFFSTSPEKQLALQELKSNDRSERYKFLYELLRMMPPEMIRMILDYESCTLKGTCEQTSHENPLQHFQNTNPLALISHNEQETVATEYALTNNHLTFKINEDQTITIPVYQRAALLSAPLICDFKQLYPVNVDHEIAAWNPKNGKTQTVDVKTMGKLLKCSQGQLLWVSDNGKILMLDPQAQTHKVQIIKDADKWDIFNIGAIADDTFVASALSGNCKECELQFWNIDQKTLSFRHPTKYPTKHHTKITTHVFALVTGESNDTIELWYWDAPTKTARRITKIALGASITSLAHLSDGNLAAGLNTGEIRIQSPLDGRFKAMLKGHEHSIGAMMQLPNGKLATKSYANEMKLWS